MLPAPCSLPCSLTIRNRQRTRAVDLSLLRQIVKTLLAEVLEIEQAELGIHLVATPEMTCLNETSLHHAGSTDVITFDYLDHASRITHQASRLHGEIFICVDEAVTQARRFRTTWQSELIRYAVHGILHLRGFDDERPHARHTMKREEDRLLRELARRFPLRHLASPRHPRKNLKSRTSATP